MKTAIALLCNLLVSVSLYAVPINVSNLATAGDGTSASPWTGWDTAITWVGEQEYYFPGGVYAYQNSPNFLKTGIALRGEAGTVLKHTGAGNAVVFDNPAGKSPVQANWTENVRMENFIIQGNAATTNGLYLTGVRNSIFRHISVRDVSNAGIFTGACVTNILDNFRVSHWENNPAGTWNVTPDYGIWLSKRAQDGAGSTAWTIINPVIEGVRTIGIKIDKDAGENIIIGGTVEGNLGKGMVLDAFLNTVIGTFFEANLGNNIEVNAPRNVLIGIPAGFGTSTPTVITGFAHMNQIIGGLYKDLFISGVNNVIQAALISGNFSDTGTNTIRFANGIGQVALRDSFLGNVIPQPVGLNISGGIVSTDANRNSSYMVTGNQPFLLDNPTNPSNGQLITWRIRQSGTGVINYGSKFRPVAGGTLPTLTTIVGEYSYISAKYNSARDTWDIQ